MTLLIICNRDVPNDIPDRDNNVNDHNNEGNGDDSDSGDSRNY